MTLNRLVRFHSLDYTSELLSIQAIFSCSSMRSVMSSTEAWSFD
jgi:hypothetical protein